jgi:hypothetical protein
VCDHGTSILRSEENKTRKWVVKASKRRRRRRRRNHNNEKKEISLTIKKGFGAYSTYNRLMA